MEINGRTVICRPLEAVIVYVDNVANDVHWQNKVTGSGLRLDAPLGVGAIGCSVVGGKKYEWRSVRHTAGEYLDRELLGSPFVGMGGYRFVPVLGDTRFTLVSNVEPSGLYKLLGPLFTWLGRRRNLTDVEKIGYILESSPGC